MTATRPRVAILGLHLESNAFAPTTTEAEFREHCFLEGDAILAEARKPAPALPMEVPGFLAAMDAAGPWDPAPILVAGTHPSGPADHGFFLRCCERIRAGLAAAAPLNAVYITEHGAMTTTASHDPDGTLFRLVREAVGPGVPIAATVDLHANVSDEMVEAVDVFIAYRTNPHVDQAERGAEAARALRELLAGTRAEHAFIRLPLTPASINLLTASGPYADLIAEGERLKDARILNVSCVGGFVFGDTPKNGIAIVVTARGDRAAARALAAKLARKAWAERGRFLKALTPLAEAVAIARAAASGARRPAIFADSGDNPGGGGRGNTTDLLRALHAAAIPRVLFGNFIDPALAAEAASLGAGARFVARFNRAGGGLAAETFDAEARVVALHGGELVGRRGIYAGRKLALGPTAALALASGVTVVVASRRYQCADPVFFESLGLDIGAAAAVGVKSRGHFRAGFDEFFAPADVFEVDTGGLTSPVLDRLPLRALPRPSFPLDRDAAWTPPAWA
jgi:microcystin degradation protein MlrC